MSETGQKRSISFTHKITGKQQRFLVSQMEAKMEPTPQAQNLIHQTAEDVAPAPADPESRMNFEGANLEGANFECANLEGANFEGANLESANFEGANLEGANFEEANLTNAHIEGANFTGANLTNAILEGAGIPVA